MRGEHFNREGQTYFACEGYKAYSFGRPKAGKSRLVNLSDFLVEELDAHIRALRKEALKAGRGGVVDLIFPDPEKGYRWPYSQRKIQYTDEDAEQDEQWLDTHFSRYNQFLEQFTEAKGIELEEPELREIPPEVIEQVRNLVDQYKAGRGETPAPQGSPIPLASDYTDNPHRIKMVTPMAMKLFKLLRDHKSGQL